MKNFINHNNCDDNDIKCKATNTISLLIGISSLSVFIIILIRALLLNFDINYFVIIRTPLVSLLAFISYFLHKKGFKVLSKFILVYSILFTLIYFPVIVNTYSIDLVIMYPIFIISLGAFSQIIFYFVKEKYYYIFMMLSLLVFLFFTDEVYSISFDEIDLYKEWGRYYFIIKLAIISQFLVINSILFYVLRRNILIFNKLEKVSSKIRKKNELILQKNEALLHKNHELKEMQDQIESQNQELRSFMEEIKTQRDEIYEKNNEIIDSIMYASRIQNSMIPKGKILYSYFDEFFILNKPKDILSGDFFWTTEYENKVIVAVADCTGHGIPASLLSVLGISALNEIVLKYKNLKSNEILNHLRTKIVIALSQSDSNDETKDGMDISLLIYDKRKKHVEFSGAYNPFVLVRDSKLYSIDGDRMPIGICEAENDFSFNSYPVEKNDMIYMFSDGYTDQFGGVNNKKIKRKIFKEQLIKLSKLPLSVQKERFSIYFNEWKGDFEQVDDVLIVGLRI